MILTIRHETVYHYTQPLSYTVAQLRLMPRIEAHQRTLSWHIESAGQRSPFTDAYGNVSQILTISGWHEEVRIVAHGEVSITGLPGGRLAEIGNLSPLVYTVSTSLTESSAAILAFAHQHLHATARSDDLLALAQAVCNAIQYQSGSTEVTTPAAAALALGRGVCQDHAHLFIACCHALSIPARYVSGYIDPGSSEHAESHAWVDVWVNEADFSGWVSIDVTHVRFADQHCRLAIGRDYDSAAPVRGVRNGGGEESLTVQVDVETNDLRVAQL